MDSVRPVLIQLAVLGVALLTWSPGVRVVGAALMGDNGAAWVQAGAGIVQALAAVVLIGYTVATVRLTRKAVAAAAASAAGTLAAVEEAQRQRLDGARPIITFLMTLHSGQGEATPDGMGFFACNIGSGPAMNLTLILTDPARPYHWKNFAQHPTAPATVAMGEKVRYELGVERPPLPDGPIPRLGTLTATYEDLYGRRFTTTVALNLIGMNGAVGERYPGNEKANFGPTTFTLLSEHAERHTQ